MSSDQNPPKIALPKAWPNRIHAAVLQVISLAQFAIVYSHATKALSSGVAVSRSGAGGETSAHVTGLSGNMAAWRFWNDSSSRSSPNAHDAFSFRWGAIHSVVN